MSNEGRAEAVAALYAWALWCEQNRVGTWSEWRGRRDEAAWHAVFDWDYTNRPWFEYLRKKPASLALCFAAAILESGDPPRSEREQLCLCLL